MIDALLEGQPRATASSAAFFAWTVICTALEITAAQECERVVDKLFMCTFSLDGQYIPRQTGEAHQS